MDPLVLARYLDGTAPAKMRAAVEAWIAADPRRRAALHELETGVAVSGRSSARTLRRGPRVAPALGPPGATDALSLDPRRRRGRDPARGRCGGGFVWKTLARRGAGARAVALRSYDVPRGRRAAFRLLDGTEILLNADSRLHVPVRFAAGQRDVYLDGEAYFSVAHDEARRSSCTPAAATSATSGRSLASMPMVTERPSASRSSKVPSA